MTNKAVLISIRPKWCELIASGKKTLEIRKTAPKIKTPFKCYIYCTKFNHGDPDSMINLKGKTSFFMPKGGAVIGEFVCDKMFKFSTRVYLGDEQEKSDDEIVSKSCVPRPKLRVYEGSRFGLYGWHISELVIYDVPKKLSDLRLYNTSAVIEDGLPMPTHEIRRPPQSWCYVEVLE